MNRLRRLGVWAALFAGFAAAGTVNAQEGTRGSYVLTLEQARDLARSQSPLLAVARARADVARGELRGAEVRPNNPELELGAGPRDGAERSTDLEVSLRQQIETGGPRDARVDRARARVEGADADSSEAGRQVLLNVSIAFLRSLHAKRSLEIADRNERLAAELRRVAEKRYEVGDVGILDPHAASMAHARGRAERGRLDARLMKLHGELRAQLGLDAGVELVLVGELDDTRSFSLPAVVDAAESRSDIRAVENRIEATDGELRLARALRSPDIGVFVRYGREENDDVVVGGVAFELPFFNRGQGPEAVAHARRRALELELEATRHAAVAEIHGAHDAHERLEQAVREFRNDALPKLDESLELARRSYEAGNIPVGELLALQREMVGARQAWLDLLLETAIAAVETESAAGMMQ